VAPEIDQAPGNTYKLICEFNRMAAFSGLTKEDLTSPALPYLTACLAMRFKSVGPLPVEYEITVDERIPKDNTVSRDGEVWPGRRFRMNRGTVDSNFEWTCGPALWSP